MSSNIDAHDKSTDSIIRHTKIIGTLGPSSSDYETQVKLVEAGLNIARLNFSHGDHDTHLKNIQSIREISKETGKTVAILQDLQGPKIRVGKLIGDKMEIHKGETYSLCYGVEQTDPKIIPIDYRGLTHDVSKGQRVMMDDGLFILEVEEVIHETVNVKVLEGGILKNRKGVNFPDSKLSLPALTDKDSKDLLFGVANNVDYIALSFVQDPADIRQIKSMIKALGSDVPVIAKIEKLPAIDTIDEIAKEADGLMVARGDLGVEANVERVPILQRKIVKAAANHGKPVIIATQMLESMIILTNTSENSDFINNLVDLALSSNPETIEIMAVEGLRMFEQHCKDADAFRLVDSAFCDEGLIRSRLTHHLRRIWIFVRRPSSSKVRPKLP